MISLGDQALFLLDIQPIARQRKNLAHFSNLEQIVNDSLPGANSREEPDNKTIGESNPFSVASRMNRPNYEDQARAEALTQALRKIRANNASRANNPRVIAQS